MRLSLPILLSALLAAVSPAAAADTDPNVRLGELFCQLRAGGDESAVSYLLTKGLFAEVEAAYARNDVIAKAAPDEKPPLGDGVPFQSFPDAAPVCRPGSVATAADAVHVDIEYRFPETPDANWTDRIVVRAEDGLPRIDDVLYGTDDHKTGLRSALVQMFQN